MLEKSRNAAFFQWFVCRVSRKVGLLKRRVRSHVVRGEIKNCTPLWRKAHFQVKMLKTNGLGALFEVPMSKNCTPLWREAHFQVKMLRNWRSWSTFWSSDVEKIARCCGEKHIHQSKCWQTDDLGALLEVLMSKNCTPLWRNARSQAKMLKTDGLGAFFEVQMSKN